MGGIGKKVYKRKRIMLLVHEQLYNGLRTDEMSKRKWEIFFLFG